MLLHASLILPLLLSLPALTPSHLLLPCEINMQMQSLIY